MGERMSQTKNLKIHPKWVKSSYLGLKLINFWLKQPVFTPKVGLFYKHPTSTKPTTWNPGYKEILLLDTRIQKF